MNTLNPVDGYLHRKAAYFIAYLLLFQNGIKCGSGLLEIGVYYGKQFIIFCLLAKKNEHIFGIDTFASSSKDKLFNNINKINYDIKK